MQSTQCLTCRHYATGMTCAAYQEKIPELIATGEHDHRQPFDGDGGLRYERAEGVEDLD